MLLLSRWQPLFANLPVETLIHDRQADYYQALSDADRQTEATVSIEFMLQAILEAMVDAELKSSEKSSEKILALLQEQPTLSAKAVT